MHDQESSVLDAVKAKAFGFAETFSCQLDDRRAELEALQRPDNEAPIDLARRRR